MPESLSPAPQDAPETAPPPTHPRTAIVVGGGLVGLCCARALRAAGLDVTLVSEPRYTPPASSGNAGHIAIEQVIPLASPAALASAPGRLFLRGGALDFGWTRPGSWVPWLRHYLQACSPARAQAGQEALRGLLAEAMPAWRRMTAELGRPELLDEAGHLMFWHDSRRAEPGMAHWLAADTGTATVRRLDADEFPDLDGVLAHRPCGALKLEGTGRVTVSPGTMMNILSDTLYGAQVRRVAARAVRLARDDAGTAVHLTDGQVLVADRVVIATGVGTKALLRTAGLSAPVVAERGYHIEWDHGGLPALPPMVFEERSMIVSRFGARLRTSSFIEFTAPDAPPDPRKWRYLEENVRDLGLPVASGFSHWMGSRPTLPDYLPAIGPLPGLPGAIAAYGHQHLGLTLAPLTAELVRALATDTAPPIALTPFRPERFSRTRPVQPLQPALAQPTPT
ncbi:FAD-binding oxidoreductase [Gluconacetobacter azotocaptans]|uniref:FAD-binding oxidoreductase n=1 Tax=Gluconacetobacter azotocaptans TaxID=142834 RepID=A0A7W4JVU1_9PROT|nr:FAD-binding oxidoreductase [Gluconacetobacter azotocaptans]MBB2191845.1 FAD-binding oxidoreductase [Gluconacetobacter azotocaptans]MBM9403477.1 FAD-binding oxidoreductase [Gluconacetobacter azotocaptans]